MAFLENNKFRFETRFPKSGFDHVHKILYLLCVVDSSVNRSVVFIFGTRQMVLYEKEVQVQMTTGGRHYLKKFSKCFDFIDAGYECWPPFHARPNLAEP